MGAAPPLPRRPALAWNRPTSLFGGDKGGRTAAYVATAAIGLAFVLSLAGFILFTFVDGDKEQQRDRHETRDPSRSARTPSRAAATRKELEAETSSDEEAELAAARRPLGRPRRLAAHQPRLTTDPERGTALQLGFRIDSLAALMFVMVTFIATLIHVFSIGYMAR